jgi:hypothetical protein
MDEATIWIACSIWISGKTVMVGFLLGFWSRNADVDDESWEIIGVPAADKQVIKQLLTIH